MDLVEDDVLHNLVTKESQHMRGITPWKGCKEKDPILLQTLIESTTLTGDIIFDCTVATGILTLSNSFISIKSYSSCPGIIDLENYISISLCARTSIQTCRRSECHIVAMEDPTIFNDILQPLIVDPVAEVLKRQRI